MLFLPRRQEGGAGSPSWAESKGDRANFGSSRRAGFVSSSTRRPICSAMLWKEIAAAYQKLKERTALPT
jgi:hypothetical protein